jgi:hypothetical protein
MRSVLVAMTVAIILPMIYTYGIAVSYTLCAVLIWVSYRYVIVLPKTKWIRCYNDI